MPSAPLLSACISFTRFAYPKNMFFCHMCMREMKNIRATYFCAKRSLDAIAIYSNFENFKSNDLETELWNCIRFNCRELYKHWQFMGSWKKCKCISPRDRIHDCIRPMCVMSVIGSTWQDFSLLMLHIYITRSARTAARACTWELWKVCNAFVNWIPTFHMYYFVAWWLISDFGSNVPCVLIKAVSIPWILFISDNRSIMYVRNAINERSLIMLLFNDSKFCVSL